MAQKILELNRGLLESTTQILLKQEVLEGSQLAMILSQVAAPPELTGFLSSR